MTYGEAFDIAYENIICGFCDRYSRDNCSECSDAWEILHELTTYADGFRWHDLRKNPEDLPPIEAEVDIAYEVCGGSPRTARAFYEDGAKTEEDSIRMCYDCDYCDDWEYDEESDSYIIPKGWYESVRFAEDTAVIDVPIIAWRYIEPYNLKR